jgi:hypothetical protein
LDFSWVPGNVKWLNNISANILNPTGVTVGQNNTVSYQISDRGFSFPGLLWKIDEFIDLNIIKENYGEAWSRLKHVNKVCTDGGPKSAEDGQFNNISKESTREQWLAMTHIFFDILIEIQASRQIEIADAIWQSILNSHWRPTGKGLSDDMIESVLDFPEGLGVEECQNMFDLGRGRDGVFYHYWFINRVMDQGGLWLGRLVQTSGNEYNMPTTRCSEAKEKVEDERSSIDAESRTQSHLDQQLVASLIRLAVENIQSRENDANINKGDEVNGGFSGITPEAFAHFAELCSRSETSDEPSGHQRAIFDIDGDASGQELVLTPFNQHCETIPRSETRSMSVSWVVGPVFQQNDAENEEAHGRKISETLKSKRMVRGMWKFMRSPTTIYNLV